MTKLTYKEQVTQTVIEQLEGSYWSFENAMKKWWQNPRRDVGLRLTPMGNQAFQTAGIEYSDHQIKKMGKSYYGFVVELSKKIKCPYYIDVSKSETGNIPYIRLYDSRIAMMLTLYGDLESYLNSVKVKK
jgi:hypothetical protein